jgi:D-alanine-D-alanine ligase-like ATP-grasp enzyme
MHDVKGLEGLGVVSVGIATTEFVDAAHIQNKYLSYDPAVVFVPHPIQDRTPEEIRALADNAFEEIIKAVSDAA